MIRELRLRHTRIWLVLAIVLPVGYAASLAGRVGIPEDPGEGLRTPDLPGSAILELAGGWGGLPIRGRGFARPEAGPWLELQPLEDLRRPDVLVYWTARLGERGVPDGAHLLGALAGTQRRRFALPEAAADGGHLLLYSLGHQQRVASAPLPRFDPRVLR